jgi:mono/diheme cytochrome c family protein
MTTGTRRNIFVLLGAAAVVLAVIAWRMLVLPAPLAFAGGTQVPLSAYRGASPVGVPAELAGADDLTKGRYLATAADCVACHTAKGGQPYAGGRAFRLPFGTLYAPNITPDRETGIGSWTDAQFLRAMHQGISRDGSRLYPAFPYASYALMSDGDVRLIRRYLATVPAVKRANLPNSFTFPYNQRWLMGFWSAFFVPGEPFRPVAERSAAWNRGAYLVEAAGHCGECHTPRTLTQAMNMREKFAGGVAEGWNAYNITSDVAHGIGGWSPQQLASYMKQGYAQGHGVASGPMAEAVERSTSKLTDSDIAAMVTYLRSIPARPSSAAVAMAKPAGGPAVADAALSTPGAQIFASACASCHAWNGAGALVGEAQLAGNRAVNDRTAANAALMVLNGMGRPDQPRRYMPSFRASYSDTEIAAVVNYVTHRYGGTRSTLTAAKVGELRKE